MPSHVNWLPVYPYVVPCECVCLCVCVSMHLRVHVYLHTRMCVVYVCVCVCVCVCVSACVCAFMRLSVCVFMCTCVSPGHVLWSPQWSACRAQWGRASGRVTWTDADRWVSGSAQNTGDDQFNTLTLCSMGALYPSVCPHPFMWSPCWCSCVILSK